MAWNDDLDEASPAYLIASSVNRRVRVLAGPGTGKSFAMKRRVARLLESGVDPERILPVTFTRVAAEDLHRELVNMNIPGCDRIQGRTIHSLALRILMSARVLAATGRIARPLTKFETRPLVLDLAVHHGGIKAVTKRIEAYVAAWARLQQDEPGAAINEADAAFEQDLLGWLRFHKAMHIGEVIPLAYRYLSTNPLAEERRQFSDILVDEYQDLNGASSQKSKPSRLS